MEWKELKIDNLPPDILTGDYEFECFKNEWVLADGFNDRRYRLQLLTYLREDYKYRYRKPEPKAPTHEEIMTKWWKIDDCDAWDRPIAYDEGKYVFILYGKDAENCKVMFEGKDYFIGRESVDIPPEGIV